MARDPGQLSEGDAYVRLPYLAERATSSTLHGGSLTFADADLGTRPQDELIASCLNVPPALLARTTALVLRCPDSWGSVDDGVLDQLDRVLHDRGYRVRIGVARFPIAAPPELKWHGGSRAGDDDGATLQRARRAELQAFMTWEQAIWRPKGYHYRLPSGHHSRTFVRVADALRDPRAAGALATWLRAGIATDGSTTVVVDSGTLSPVISELRAAAERAGRDIYNVLSLDEYPTSKFAYRQLLKPAQHSRVLGVISVSATGTVHRRFLDVLRETVGEDFRLERLVARRPREEPAASQVPLELVSGDQEPWLNLGDQLDLPVSMDDTACAACLNPASARLVHIHPSSMSAMVLPEPQLIVPDIVDARRNRGLWERYCNLPLDGDKQAISTLGPTNTRANDTRQQGDLQQVFFEPAFLANVDPKQMIESRIAEIGSIARRSPTDPSATTLLNALSAVTAPSTDALIVDTEEYGQYDAEHWEKIVRALEPLTGRAEPQVVLHDAKVSSLEAATGSMNTDPERVGVLALGVRTGVTIQRMFLTARASWPAAEIRGLAFHAHPSDSRIWESIRNTFRDGSGVARLLALWLTFLPRRSPLAEEQTVLRSVAERELDRPLRDLRNERLRTPQQVLWAPTTARVRPGSYYGHALDPNTAFVAVGSAMHSARLRARSVGTPHWAVFDIPRVFRSYFDGVLQAAVIRWLAPHECWWGDSPDECVTLLLEVEGRMPPQDWDILLAELLLAGAESKLPVRGVEHLLDAADKRLRGTPKPELPEMLSLGQRLCEIALGRD